MHLPSALLSAIAMGAIAHPEAVKKRQGSVSELLELASLAGITALPTDPAVLLSLGPIANQLASALPTEPVLSVLKTAAPSGFISQIVNDPTFASSFESAFAAGSSPTWFNSLPTDVKSYLHTYSGFAGLATAAGEINSLSLSGSSGASAAMTGLSSSTATSTGGTSSRSTTNSASTATSSGAGASAASVTSAAASSTSTGGAAHPTGAIAAGMVGVAGILGLAIAL